MVHATTTLKIAGIATLHEGLVAYQASGAEMSKTLFLSMFAETYGKAGQPAAGLQAVADASDFVASANEHAYEAELYRLQGELTLQTSDGYKQKAEACFLRSIEIAQCQNAKSWELRATMNLAKLWGRQGRPRGAGTARNALRVSRRDSKLRTYGTQRPS